MGQNEKPISVTVIQNSQAKLPCNISANKPGGKVATILWYKGMIGEPIFTYDSRTGGPGNATIWTDEEQGFGKRAVFDINTRPEAFLYVNSIKVSESGTYRCRLLFLRRYLGLLMKHGKRVGTSLEHLEEGTSLMLICISQGGYPPPTLIWNDNSSPGTKEPIDTSFKVVEAYLGKTYECVAKNNDLLKSASMHVTINMRLLPINVSILPPEESFSINRETLLECRSYGSRPPATLTWWKRGKFIGQSPTKMIHTDNETYSISHIRLRPKASDHGKDITCRSENTNILGSAIQSDLRLNVQYPPKVILTLGKNVISNLIRLSTKSIGITMAVDSLITVKKGLHIASGGKNLVIQGVKRAHRGNYTCVGYNIEGSEASDPITLNIRYKPECVISQIKVLGIVQHQESKILCEFSSYPGVSFISSEASSFNASFSSLTYNANSAKDYGYLLCFATNLEGEGPQPCIFKLIPAGPPEAPIDCDVRNHTRTGLGVICQKGFDGGLYQVFHLEVTDRGSGDLLQNMTHTEPNFNIRGFESSRSVNLKLYSSNSYGRSLTTVQLETTPSKVAELQIESPPSDTSQKYMGIIVGVLGTLIIVISTSLIVIYCCSKDDRSRRSEGGLNCLRGSRQGSNSSSFIEVPEGVNNNNNPRVIIRQFNNANEEQKSSGFGGKMAESVSEKRSLYSQEPLLSAGIPGTFSLDERPPPPKVIFNSSSSSSKFKKVGTQLDNGANDRHSNR
ncbi:unnamed protein product [Lepeophtheirus salmonis]|uniref:(salmon louse) hypothetical protein n=1 Tax=Lepeophtheirus salmonis TaxID=72036 RepID=A0A7R8HCG7_LEPSM|nr:unnamed protein product [Lepeophtheirus salmonis]CAF2991455.1 unnamed protein product [Lepeophtheirus salmonis]